MQKTFAKKAFAVGLAVSTALWAVAPLAATAAAHAVGTNVISSDGTVWMIMSGGVRRAYTSEGAFLSYGFNSWSTVVPANADDLALTAGDFIPPQDGSIICSDRGTDKGTCYLVSLGKKHGFISESVFTGQGFSFANSKQGDVSWMQTGANIESADAAHLPGTLVRYKVNASDSQETVFLVGTSGMLGIPSLTVFTGWGYSFNKVVSANAADKAKTMSCVMSARNPGELSPSFSCTGGQSGQTSSGSVTAALAYDTPASQTVAVHTTYKSVVTLAKYTFTGSGTVTQLQVKRIGVSSDTSLSNVYLFDGTNRLTDAASVGGNSLVTFMNPNGLFTVSGSKTVSVVAEIAANTSSGTTVGVQLASFTVGTGTAATLAISGNLFTVSSTTDLAYATFGTVTPSGAAYDPAKDIEVFRSNVTVNTRNMTLSRMIIRNIGSAQQADLSNFRLMVDGKQVAQVGSMDNNGYVYFGFSPLTLQSGSRVFSVLADVVGGSSRNFQYQIRNVADVDFTDSQYGVTVAASNTFPVGSASSNSINSGTMTIQKDATSPSGNVTDNTSDVVLAKYTVTAYGEPLKIETVKVGVTSSDASVGSLRNGRVLVNGVQYGSTATLAKTTNNTYTTGGTSYTLNYTVQPGTPVTLEVRADMYDNDGTNHLSNSDTVTAYVMADGTSNVQRMVSLGYVAVPSASVAGNQITNVTGSMTLSKNGNYANQTTPLPQTQYKLGSYNLLGSTSEEVTVNSLDIKVSASSSLFDYSKVNNVKAMIAGQMFGSIKATLGSGTSTFSGSYTVKKGETVAVEFWADLQTPGSGAASGEYIATNICANGTTVNSSSSVTVCTAGQTLTYGTGSFTIAADASTPVAALISGSQTKTVAMFKYTATNDAYTISELVFGLTAYTSVTSVVVKDGNTTVATGPGGTATVTLSNLNIKVDANTSKVLTVDLVLGNVAIGAGQSGENVKVTVSSTKYAPSSTGVVSTDTSQVPAGNNMYVVKAVPTITNVSLPSGALVAGSNTLAKFTITSNGGSIGWTHMVFTYATSSGVTITTPTLWVDGGSQVTASSSVDVPNSRIVVDTATEQTIGTFVLKATVGGVTTNSYVYTNIANPSSSMTGFPKTAPTATATIATSFVWSDLSGSYTTGTPHSMTTWDWYGDTLVKNLPTDSQSLKY